MSKSNSEAYNNQSDVSNKTQFSPTGGNTSGTANTTRGSRSNQSKRNESGKYSSRDFTMQGNTKQNTNQHGNIHTGKSGLWLPARTSSAPPQEHPSETTSNSQSFQPTKTNSIIGGQMDPHTGPPELNPRKTPNNVPVEMGKESTKNENQAAHEMPIALGLQNVHISSKSHEEINKDIAGTQPKRNYETIPAGDGVSPSSNPAHSNYNRVHNSGGTNNNNSSQTSNRSGNRNSKNYNSNQGFSQNRNNRNSNSYQSQHSMSLNPGTPSTQQLQLQSTLPMQNNSSPNSQSTNQNGLPATSSLQSNGPQMLLNPQASQQWASYDQSPTGNYINKNFANHPNQGNPNFPPQSQSPQVMVGMVYPQMNGFNNPQQQQQYLIANPAQLMAQNRYSNQGIQQFSAQSISPQYAGIGATAEQLNSGMLRGGQSQYASPNMNVPQNQSPNAASMQNMDNINMTNAAPMPPPVMNGVPGGMVGMPSNQPVLNPVGNIPAYGMHYAGMSSQLTPQQIAMQQIQNNPGLYAGNPGYVFLNSNGQRVPMQMQQLNPHYMSGVSPYPNMNQPGMNNPGGMGNVPIHAQPPYGYMNNGSSIQRSYQINGPQISKPSQHLQYNMTVNGQANNPGNMRRNNPEQNKKTELESEHYTSRQPKKPLSYKNKNGDPLTLSSLAQKSQQSGSINSSTPSVVSQDTADIAEGSENPSNVVLSVNEMSSAENGRAVEQSMPIATSSENKEASDKNEQLLPEEILPVEKSENEVNKVVLDSVDGSDLTENNAATDRSDPILLQPETQIMETKDTESIDVDLPIPHVLHDQVKHADDDAAPVIVPVSQSTAECPAVTISSEAVPLIKNIPVSITALKSNPTSMPSTAKESVQPVIPVPAPTKKKRFIGKDTDAIGGDMLSAYTTSVVVPKVETVVTEPPVESFHPSPAVAPQQMTLPDSWEDGESVVPTIFPNNSNNVQGNSTSTGVNATKRESTSRSLRPTNMKLGSKQAVPMVLRYIKEQIMALKPLSINWSNPIPLYAAIHTASSGAENAAAGQNNSTSRVGYPSSGNNFTPQGGKWNRNQAGRSGQPNYNPNADNADPNGFMQNTTGWKRGSEPTSNQTGPAGQRSGKRALSPMPKKLIADAMEQLSIDVTALLNKITPQTFEKLSEQFLAFEIINTSMLDRLIKLIFEFAVREIQFASMYAELCSYLDSESSSWVFYMIVRSMEDDKFFWIKDFSFEPLVYGPYQSVEKGVTEVQTIFNELTPQPSNKLTLQDIEIVLINNFLIKIMKSVDTGEYYVSSVVFDSIDKSNRSETMFADYAGAEKNARTKNRFRGRLLTACQEEFNNSTQYESNALPELEKKEMELLAIKSTLNPAVFEEKMVEIHESRIILKNRFIGNICFVGELYKQGLLNTSTVYEVVEDLLGIDRDSECWKPSVKEQHLELMCRLLRTVGFKLETAKNPERFEKCFSRMTELSKDKKLTTRIRFSIKDVLDLRANNWQTRRQHEGPLKIAELHQKMKDDEAKAQQRQSVNYGSYGSPSNNYAASSNQLPPKALLGRGNNNPGVAMVRQFQNNNINTNNASYGPLATMPRGNLGGSSHNTSTTGRSPASNVRNGVASSHPHATTGSGISRMMSIGPGASPDTHFNSTPIRRINSEYQENHPTPSYSASDSHHPAAGYGDVHEPSTSVHSLTVNHSFDDMETLNRVKSALSDYIASRDVTCVTDLFGAYPPSILGYLIIHIAQRLLNMKKGQDTTCVVHILDEETVVHPLLSNREIIESALSHFEEFKMLPDTTTDFPNAAEVFAKFFLELVNRKLISNEFIQQLCNNAKVFNTEMDSYTPEEIEHHFDSFLNSYAKEVKLRNNS